MRRLAIALAALSVGSCQCANPAALNGTALFVIVDLNSLKPDQLAFSLSTDTATVLLRPVAPGDELSDPQTARLLLPDMLAGQVVTVRVGGLSRNTEIGSGQASVTVVLGLETEVRVRLQRLGPDGGVTDAGGCGPGTCAGCCVGGVCKTGDEQDACGTGGNSCEACASNDNCVNHACEGCNPAKCNGCCRGSLCVTDRSIVFCGADGGSCHSCPPLRSDCRPDGTCGCGPNPSCALGQRCKQGACVCDNVSCPDGCCDPATGACIKGNARQCGFGGEQCTPCQPGRSDTCSPTGTCGCGNGPQCAANSFCDAGACFCNAASCPAGCCDGNVCRSRSPDFCAPSGAACVACDLMRANACGSDGGCVCYADGRSCGPGQRCTAAGCICDALTCPNGCCLAGTTCITNPSSSACGANGSSCSNCLGSPCDGGICVGGGCAGCSGCCANGVSCTMGNVYPLCANASGAACQVCDNRSNTCSAMGCACGQGPACALGQYCTDAGTCGCNSSSCSGCCGTNNGCEAGNLDMRCGGNGGTCTNCLTAKADHCDVNQCKCGNNPTCGFGERCDGGQCACDTTLCTTGCCSGSACVPRDAGSLMACGASGVCKVCDTSKANSCTGGNCTCGMRAECGPGEVCQGGNCVCGPGTGCTGCCVGGTQCIPLGATAKGQCGAGGGACVSCPGLQQCSNGACCLLDIFGLCIGTGG